jgi:hypothetical protein
MRTTHSRVLLGMCRVVGHRWIWRVESDLPYHECTRCGARWEVGRPVPRDFEDFKMSVLANCRTPGLAAYDVWKDASLRYPEMHASDLLRLAERTVAELLDEGRIRLLRGLRSMPEQPRRAVQGSEQALRQWSTWAAQVDEVIWLERVDTG